MYRLEQKISFRKVYLTLRPIFKELIKWKYKKLYSLCSEYLRYHRDLCNFCSFSQSILYFLQIWCIKFKIIFWITRSRFPSTFFWTNFMKVRENRNHKIDIFHGNETTPKCVVKLLLRKRCLKDARFCNC